MSQVSVIVPCRNAQAFIAEALRSVLRQPELLEVVLVDDGSSDRSIAIALGLGDARVRVIPGPQKGIAAAYNAGLAEAKGAIIARCDADDAYPEDRLAWQVAWLAANPGYAAVCGPFMTIDSSGHELAQFEFARKNEDITSELLSGQARTHFCTYACRADVLRGIGGCREWFKTGEDLDLQFRVAGAGRVAFVPRLAYRYRIHDRSITHQQHDVERDFYFHTAREFARQRAATGRDALQNDSPPFPPVGEGRKNAKSHSQGLLLGHAWRQNAAGHRWQSIVIGCRAVAAGPHNLEAWRSVGALVLRSVLPRPATTGNGSPS